MHMTLKPSAVIQRYIMKHHGKHCVRRGHAYQFEISVSK